MGIDPRTVNKMMKFSVPPGYVRKKPPAKPKLDPFIVVIDGILGDDKFRPKKQQHTAKRLFERLRDEHGFIGWHHGWRRTTEWRSLYRSKSASLTRDGRSDSMPQC